MQSLHKDNQHQGANYCLPRVDGVVIVNFTVISSELRLSIVAASFLHWYV